jgi:hypothetical protein
LRRLIIGVLCFVAIVTVMGRLAVLGSSSRCYVRSISVVLGRNLVLADFVRDWEFRGYCAVCILSPRGDESNTVATVPYYYYYYYYYYCIDCPIWKYVKTHNGMHNLKVNNKCFRNYSSANFITNLIYICYCCNIRPNRTLKHFHIIFSDFISNILYHTLRWRT